MKMNTAKETCRDTYNEFARRIKAATTPEAVKQIEAKMDTLYSAGCLTTNQFSRLCDKATDRVCVELKAYDR